ncbi:MAG: hypothetical protein ABIJ09_15930 [Pseudomonadota bacterium]
MAPDAGLVDANLAADTGAGTDSNGSADATGEADAGMPPVFDGGGDGGASPDAAEASVDDAASGIDVETLEPEMDPGLAGTVDDEGTAVAGGCSAVPRSGGLALLCVLAVLLIRGRRR